jgi:single-strand DNA-binding protein
VEKYFSKGRMAVVFGRLQIRSWTDKDGNKRKTAEVVADNVYFGDSKNDSSSVSNYGTQATASYAMPTAAPASDYAMLEDFDAQLPF